MVMSLLNIGTDQAPWKVIAPWCQLRIPLQNTQELYATDFSPHRTGRKPEERVIHLIWVQKENVYTWRWHSRITYIAWFIAYQSTGKDTRYLEVSAAGMYLWRLLDSPCPFPFQ